MSVIRDAVIERIKSSGAEVYYVPRECAKWWNAQRGDNRAIIALLCGWYWSRRGKEAGPFKTISAAQRDIYYREVTRQRPPLMDGAEYQQAKTETTKLAARSPKARNGHAYAGL